MPHRFFFVAILNACMFGIAFGATTFYVAPGGNDNPPNDGSAALPIPRKSGSALSGINA